MVHTLCFFSLQNAVYFIILTYLVHVLFTFYIQNVLKLKNIYSTNIGTEYFKHGLYSPFFSSKCSLFHNPNLFGSCIIKILYTGVLKLKNIYSTNIGTECFKHEIYSPFFPSKCSLFHNSNIFGSCIIHILYTGYAKIKKKNPARKG